MNEHHTQKVYFFRININLKFLEYMKATEIFIFVSKSQDKFHLLEQNKKCAEINQTGRPVNIGNIGQIQVSLIFYFLVYRFFLGIILL